MAQMNNHLEAQKRGPGAARAASLERAAEQRRQGHAAGMEGGGPAPKAAADFAEAEKRLESLKHHPEEEDDEERFTHEEVRAHLDRAERGEAEEEVHIEKHGAWSNGPESLMAKSEL